MPFDGNLHCLFALQNKKKLRLTVLPLKTLMLLTIKTYSDSLLANTVLPHVRGSAV